MVQLRPRASRAPPSAMVDEAPAAPGEEGAEADEAEAATEPRDGGAENEDEAPEELTFASAQAEARAEAARAREAARRDKAQLREKRRRREELFVEQKKRKLLPEALLRKLAAAPPARARTAAAAKAKAVDSQKQSEDAGKQEPRKTQARKVQSAGLSKSYVAVRLKDQDLRDCRQLAAKAFIQNSLYGPGTRRMTVNKFLSLENKRLPVKKAAAQFLNPAWATQKKQNAKRFAKRWMIRKRNAKK